MKKTVSLILLLVFLLSACAFASPDAKSETVDISFLSEFGAVVPEPFGRWADELFAMVTLRAERLTWEDGSLTEVFFLVNGKDACSIGLLRLENDILACGTLLPEGPVPLSSSQKEIFVGWPDSLFHEKGEEDTARYTYTPEALAASFRQISNTCLELRVDVEEYGSLDAVAQIVDTLAGVIEESENTGPLLTIELKDVDNLYGYKGEEIDLDILDGLAEELLSRFLNTMMWSIALLEE